MKTKTAPRPLRAQDLARVAGGGGLMSLLNTSATAPPSPEFRTIALAD